MDNNEVRPEEVEEVVVEEEGIVEEDIIAEVSPEEIQQSLDSLKIEVTEEDKEKYAPVTEKKTRGRKKTVIPNSDELSEMNDNEVVENMTPEDQDLYMEFASFLEDKAKIKQDSGVKETIPTGIEIFDAIMGGGFALGTMGTTIGPPGCGKSMLCIQAMGAAQKKYKEKVIVAMLDSEEATTTIRMANLGVRYPKIKPYNDITVEKVFKFLEGLCLYKEMKKIVDNPSVICWDSIANTLSQKEREVEDVNSAIGYKARILSLLIPKYVAKLAAYNICFLTVNQMRDNIKIGPFSSPKELRFMSTGKTIPGGNTMKFNAFHLIEMKVTEAVDESKYGFEGIKATAWCVKNKLFSPNIPIKLVGNFVTGFSNFWTNFEFLSDNKRINTGAWNFLVDLPTVKFRTKDALTTYNTNPSLKEVFDKAVKECINSEIINKNIISD